MAKGTTKLVNPLDLEIEVARKQVVLDELKARFHKAQFETAYYALEFEKILPDYSALIEKKVAESNQVLKETLGANTDLESKTEE